MYLYNVCIIFIFKFIKIKSHVNLMVYYEIVWKIHSVRVYNIPGEIWMKLIENFFDNMVLSDSSVPRFPGKLYFFDGN